MGKVGIDIRQTALNVTMQAAMTDEMIPLENLLKRLVRAVYADAAEIAKAHKDSAAKKRRERDESLKGKPLSFVLAQEQIWAEENGEDIASEMISKAILEKAKEFE